MKKSIYTGPVRTISFEIQRYDEMTRILAFVDGKSIAKILYEYEVFINSLDEAVTQLYGWKRRKRFSEDIGFRADRLDDWREPTAAHSYLSSRSNVCLLVCGCGECDQVSASSRMKVTQSHVHWYNFKVKKVSLPKFGIFTFDRDQYQAACKSLSWKFAEFSAEKFRGSLILLEDLFHDYAVRRNRIRLGELLSSEFTQMDSSGKIISREELLDEAQHERSVTRKISNFQIKLVNTKYMTVDIFQTTYLLREVDTKGKTSQSIKTSIWRRVDYDWKLFSHQSMPYFK
ncbi:MAG: DUF4440 domain-containing protein [Phycisphaerales bacterium]